jgi:hypothetical protein
MRQILFRYAGARVFNDDCHVFWGIGY